MRNALSMAGMNAKASSKPVELPPLDLEPISKIPSIQPEKKKNSKDDTVDVISMIDN